MRERSDGAAPYDVVCFAVIDWDFRWQRPQQLMTRYARRGHRVFYVSPTRLSTTTEPEIVELAPGIHEIRLALARPFDVYGSGPGIESVNRTLASLTAVRNRFDVRRAVAMVQVASWRTVARAARERFGWPVVYDCMDDWQTFPGIGESLRSDERRLVREADGLVVSAAKLLAAWRDANGNSVLARNAADFDFFRNPPPSDLLADCPRPIAGYFGAIASWFDVGLVSFAAEQRPDVSFVLVGGVFDIDVAPLEKYPNVYILGQQPYETMPAYLAKFDVCLVPFDASPATEAMDVVKFYEYISQGKPVVSTPLPELAPYRDYVYLASGREEFVAQLERALDESDRSLAARRLELAEKNSWDARVDGIEPVIERAFQKRREVEWMRVVAEDGVQQRSSEEVARATPPAALLEKLAEQREALDILSMRYDELQKERATLQESVEFLNRELAARRETIEQRDAAIAFLQRDVEQGRLALEASKRERNDLARALDSRQEAIDFLQRDVDSRQEAIDFRTAERDAALAAVETLRQEQRDLLSALESRSEAFRHLEELRAAALAEVERVRAEAQQMLALRDSQLERYEERAKQHLEGIEWLRGEVEIREQKLAEREARLEALYHSKMWKTADVYWRSRRTVARAVRPLVSTPKNALLAVGRKVLPRGAKRFLKRFWDPNERISAQEAIVLNASRGLLASSPVAAPNRPGKYDVICFSIIDWSFRWQRPQQLMSQFANEGHRVFFFKTTEFLTSGEKYRVRVLRDNVWEIELGVPHPIDVYSGELAPECAAAVLADLQALRGEFHISCAVSMVQTATWAAAAFAAREKFGWRVVYDCMDEWDTFPGMKEAMIASEQKLVSDADLLVVSAQRLLEKFESKSHAIVLARNATDFRHFHDVPPNDLLRDEQRPIVGYFGAIADWFDLPLMLRLAQERPQYTFVLLGGVFDVDVSSLEALPNVRILGQKPYDLMPAYLQHFDACIIPFVVNAVTEATDPVKFYEYVSQGKPVVAPRMPELYPYRDYLYIADDHDDFIANVDRAVLERDSELQERRVELAQQNTWEARVNAIDEKIVAVHPRVSIVIITYHNLELTRLCVDSVFRNTLWPNFEIIIVDNNSNDGTQDYLRQLEKEHSNVRVILNEKNVGFAAANNQGLAIATGDYLVLLNNDTVVPNGWLPKMLRHLGDEEIGLIVTVTNFSGNESRIEVPYNDLDAMETFAETYTREHEGVRFDIGVAAMYCVAMRRDVYEKVGPLDDRFSVGMFEDDDYSHRMRLAGYRVVCVEDAFVHHFGQASFKKLSSSEYQAVWDRNQRLYEQKWGKAWQPHQVRARG